MANLVKMTIQFRRDTTENWLKYGHVVPVAGEPCYDLNLKTLKIGDGETPYSQLPVVGGDKIELAADGNSVVLEDNVFKLIGFDKAEVGAQAVKGEDGKLKWVVPSTKAIDDLKTEVAGIKSNVTTLSATVKTIQDLVGQSTDGSATLLSRVNTLESKMDGTGEGTVDAKIDAKIKAFAESITPDSGKVDTLMELINYVETHGKEAANLAAGIKSLQELVGTTSVKDQILDIVNASGHMAEKKAKAMFEHVKFEISHKPEGALVDYRENEIRVMVPADHQWTKQNVGGTGNANMYYMGFKAYAPEGATSFKEGDRGVIVDQMFTFDDDFAGIDEFGRKYSICWFALASYDEASDKWNYFGKTSSFKKYLGWDYVVEWYDVNGVKIGADSIRINLSNESCHLINEPYYMANVVKTVSVGGTLLDMVDGKVDIPVGAGLKGSDEIKIGKDGTMTLGTVSWDKISQGASELVLDGGSAA